MKSIISSALVILRFFLVITLVAGLSAVSISLWGGEAEKATEVTELQIDREMTLARFGQANNLANPVLKSVFGLQSKSDLNKRIEEYDLTNEQIQKKVEAAAALNAEEESKDWIKIFTKFVSWSVFLVMAFFLMRKGSITPRLRKKLYIAAAFIFGIVLGSDPSAMGTIKDAVTLYASNGVFFPPRMVALGVFLLMAFLANKFICSWGCQAGVLQDLIFRQNRNERDTKGIFRQYKPPFVITNTFRIMFFGVFTLAAFLWSIDIIEFIDPFKIYKPMALGTLGIGFVGLLLIASLFVYRPWCHLFCPFGLIGWLVEKISLYRIKVNYDSCIACEACAKACPSTVMNAILKQENTIPDCFACANCIDVCPTDSVTLARGKRDIPPAGKFTHSSVD